MTSAAKSSSATPDLGVWPWIAGAALAALGTAGGAFALHGAGQHGAGTALFLTGRLAFLFFWPSYAGGALATLFGSAFQAVRRRARPLGLAFAAVIAVHLSVVGWLCWIGGAPPLQTFLIFGVAAGWVLALAACSIERVSRAVGAGGWWILRNIGMNYILFAFASDFLRPQHPMTMLKALEYLPFAALCVLGPLLRLLAWLSRVLHERAARPAPAQANERTARFARTAADR